MKLFILGQRRRKNSSVIKAGRYEDLPPSVQRAIDRTEFRVNKFRKKHSNMSLEERIKNILLGKEC